MRDHNAPETSRILIVDDEDHLCQILEHLLRVKGEGRYEPYSVRSGQHALEEVRRKPPDLIVLDVMMPGLDGFEVCRRLKSDPMTSRIPIILLTARQEAIDKRVGLEQYADDYVTKPFDNDELLFRIRNQLRARRMLLDSNALTGLPGNVLIESELNRRIAERTKFAFMQIDLDAFKSYNDYYGYVRGDTVIRFVAQLIEEHARTHGNGSDFVGHIGGDDFVVITTPNRARVIARSVKQAFDKRIPDYYDPADRARGGVSVLSSRQGGIQLFPILTVTILIVTNVTRDIRHSAQVADIAKELKIRGKATRGSVVVSDRRQDGASGTPSRVQEDGEVV